MKNFISRSLLVAVCWLSILSIAFADDNSIQSNLPLPASLEVVEPSRIADAIELSAKIYKMQANLWETRHVVWVKIVVNHKNQTARSIKAVHWSIKDLWLEDVAEAVSTMTFKNTKNLAQPGKENWYYQPVIFTLSKDAPAGGNRSRRRRDRSSSKPSVSVIVEPSPLYFAENEVLKNLKKKSKGSSVTLLAQLAPDGKIDNVMASHSSGKKSLKKAAFKSASLNKFTPLFINGKPEGTWISYRIDLYIVDDSLRLTTTFEPPIDSSSNNVHKPSKDEFVPVEVMPELISATSPEYPSLARNAKITGRVWMKVLVGIDGRVTEASVGKSSGHSFLDDLALRVARMNLFSPGIQNGKPVVVWVTYKVDFGQ